MRAFAAWRDGIRRVASAPGVVVAAWIVTTLVGFPLALAIRADITHSLGSSLAADAAARGMNYEWMEEFGAHATGLASTFKPTIVGFAATLDNLSAFFDNVRRPTAVIAAAGVYLLCWAFLSGGVIERYATDRSVRTGAFMSACGRYFFRFFRFAILTVFVYIIAALVHRWVLGVIYLRAVRGVDAEGTVFLIRVAFYLVFVLLLAAANLVFDIAKIRMVVEDRRSVMVALTASWRFIRQNTSAAIGVYVLDAVTFALVLAAYSFVAPGGGGTGAMVWAAVLIGQAYIVGRLCVRLLFFASEVSLVGSVRL
jgi:hypothetical protein